MNFVLSEVYEISGVKKMDIEWERYIYTLPKTGARIERIREVVMNDSDLEFMELSRRY
jgi:hypothetical protein